jgi:hypothetical protein
MSKRRANWRAWSRPSVGALLAILAVVSSIALTMGPADGAPGGKNTSTTTTPTAPTTTTTTTPTSTGSNGVATPKLIAVVSLSRHRVLATYDRDLDAAALQQSSYVFYSTQAVNLPVTGVSRATNNQVYVMTGPQEPVKYTVKLPKTSKTLSFTGSALVEPRLVSATPLSKTQILVTFSMPMGATAFLPTSYKITAVGTGAPLAVLSATQYDSTATKVLLTTGPQQAIAYVMNVVDVLGGNGAYIEPGAGDTGFTGSTVLPGPMLLTGSSDGDTRVILAFDVPLDPASAANPANYVVTPSLTILSAVLQADNRQVVLTTSPQYQVDYTMVVNVLGADGNPTNPSFNSVRFRGNRAIDTSRPKVVTAASTGNKTVIVQFSKPMADNAANPSRYTIVQAVTHPEVGALIVTAAQFVGTDHLSVELTTLSQAEVTYQVTVNNVTDVLGLPLADKTNVAGVIVDPTSFIFPGTPPAYLPCPRPDSPIVCVVVDERVNSDTDALWDHEETRGWEIGILKANGTTESRQVTSNPFSNDTDHDGLPDDQERSLNIDPRDSDTDDDDLTDWAEFNEIYSDPTKQDTDADGIFDGYEVKSFRTSPIQADSDGDQRSDSDEININRNPRVSDLPRSALDVGEIGLNLDVRFTDTTTTGQSTTHGQSVTTSLTQSQSKEYSSTDSRTIEAASKLAQTAGVSVEIPTSALGFLVGDTKATVSYEATSEQSASQSFTSSFTDTSAEQAVEAYEESLSSSETLSSETSRVRTVEGASIKVSAMLRSAGDIAFTMKNVQLSALVQDPENPARLVPVATLTPESPPAEGFSLGPLSPDRGPVIFSSQPGQVFPLQVEDLMRNPRSVVIRFSNYDLTDEQGRNFAFTSQDVFDRTAGLVIDYGSFDSNGDGRGDATENHRVATSIGRFVADTNGNGVIDTAEGRGPAADSSTPGARWAAFDYGGNQIGLTLREELQTAGLVEYDEADTPTNSLSVAERSRSYSVIDVPGFGERIHRIRQAVRAPGKEWQIWTPTGLDRTLGLDDIMVLPGKTYRLTFVEDMDDDGLPGVLEWVNGCKDTKTDTDVDGLDDRFETVIGWNIALGLWGQVASPSRAFSSCNRTDSDSDRLGDAVEAPGVLIRDARGVIASGDALGPGSVAVNGTSVAGTGTTFTSTFDVGDSITVAGEVRQVTAIASNTALTVNAAFPSPGTGMAYFFIADAPSRKPLGATYTVGNEAAMLALSASLGDFAIRSDLDPDGAGPVQASLFMLTATPASVRANWVKAPTNDPGLPVDPVKRAMGDPISNPAKPDTDADGILDGDEFAPHQVKLRFPGPLDATCPTDASRKCTPLLITSPEWKDSDGDSATDGLEAIVGGDPTQSDRDNFADDDNDGLVNIQETTARFVSWEDLSLNGGWAPGSDANVPCVAVCGAGPVFTTLVAVTSDPKVADTDGDGLNDRQEMQLGTNPRSADSDDDGLTDKEEVVGVDLPGFGKVFTKPLDTDSDNDRLVDGQEADRFMPFVVRPEGAAPYQAHTSPVNADRDFDNLVDGEEFLSNTDPGKANTDGDPRSDYVEVDRGRNPLLADMLVKMNFVRMFMNNDGEGDAGDIELFLYGQRPDGTKVPAVHSFGDTREGVAPIFGIQACGSDTICRSQPPDPPDSDFHQVIRIDTGETLFFNNSDGTSGRTVDLGSVSMTDAIPQQFGIAGHLYERENHLDKDIDCRFDLPDPFVTDAADGTGSVRGSDMKLGTNAMTIHRQGSCLDQDEFEFTLYVSYTAS